MRIICIKMLWLMKESEMWAKLKADVDQMKRLKDERFELHQNAMKRFCIYLQPMIPPKRFDIFPP